MPKQLTKAQTKNLQAALEGMSFSCGAPLQELDLSSDLVDNVFIHSLNCHEPIEALYYSTSLYVCTVLNHSLF